MNVHELPIGGVAVELEEPEWGKIYSDELLIEYAHQMWADVITEMKTLQTLSAGNAAMIERLVHARIAHFLAAREVAENGMVEKPRRGNSRAIARLSPYFAAMREASSDCDRMEEALGLTPKGRVKAGKIAPVKKAVRASDEFIKGQA